jgi:hypothetical protein
MRKEIVNALAGQDVLLALCCESAMKKDGESRKIRLHRGG